MVIPSNWNIPNVSGKTKFSEHGYWLLTHLDSLITFIETYLGLTQVDNVLRLH